MAFNMNATWSKATSLVGANFSLLAVVAGVFLFLPAVVIYLAVPDMAAFMDPTADPEKMAAMMEGMMGEIFGWSALAMIFQFVGYLAMVALMGKARPTVGEALAQGAKSLPTMIGTLILFMIAYAILALVIAVPLALLGTLIGPLGAVLTMIGVLFVALFLMTRFCVVMPVVMLEDTLNPITAMKRSWQITRPSQWSILGFWALLIVAYFVIAMLVFGVMSLMGAMAATSTGSLLVMGIVNGIVGGLVAMLVSGIVVAMHQQLAGDNPANLSETFE